MIRTLHPLPFSGAEEDTEPELDATSSSGSRLSTIKLAIISPPSIEPHGIIKRCASPNLPVSDKDRAQTRSTTQTGNEEVCSSSFISRYLTFFACYLQDALTEAEKLVSYKNEISPWKEMNAMQVVHRSTMPPNANTVSSHVIYKRKTYRLRKPNCSLGTS